MKGLVTIIFILISVLRVKAKENDTLVFYYRTNYNGYPVKVKTADSAIFCRMIFPTGNNDGLLDVREYYVGGILKFAGKSEPPGIKSYEPGAVVLSGNCISYYPNGKRQSITHYINGEEEGFQYVFYPNGAPYTVVKNFTLTQAMRYKTHFLECYTKEGVPVCTKGNGKWLIYNYNFQDTLLTGPIINGTMEGIWHGKVPGKDSITYIKMYKHGLMQSGTGYDKNKFAYNFIKDDERADYKTGLIDFVNHLKKYPGLSKSLKLKRELI